MAMIKNPFLTQSLKFIAALTILLACLYSAKWLVWQLSLPFPAALLGMLFLLALLGFKILPSNWLAPACQPILKYMALFFIPAGVGLVQYLNVFKNHWLLLALILVLIPIIGLVIVGKIVHQGCHDD